MIKNLFKKNTSFTNIQKDQFKELMTKENTLILDVRTPYEYLTGNIERSVNIDIMNNEFNEKVKELDKNAHVLVYCRSGARSQIACEKISNLGFNHVYNLSGGYNKW